MKLSHLFRQSHEATSLRERASALREGLNRREAVLGTSLAVAVPLPAAASLTVAPHPDAGLIGLWQKREEAHSALQVAAARWDAIEDAEEALQRPATLYLQDGDEALGIAALAIQNGVGRLWYCVGDIDSIHPARALRRPRRRQHARPVRPEDNLPANAHTVIEMRPWPEAQARADAIVNAWDDWRAEIARQNEASGLAAARAAWNACSSAFDAIEDKIAATAAHTITGLTIKARVAQSWDECGYRDPDPLTASIVVGLIALDALTA